MRDQPSCWCLTGSWWVCTTWSSIFGSHHTGIFSFNNSLLTKTGIQYLDNLRTSSPGRSVGVAVKGRRACNYVSGIWISICIENVDAKCWLAEMTLVMTSLPLARVFQCFFFFFTLAIVSASRWLARKLDSSVDGEPQGHWRWNSNSRDEFASSPSFSRPVARAPRRAYSQGSTWNPEETAWNPKSKRPGLSWILSHWVIKIVTWSSLS